MALIETKKKLESGEALKISAFGDSLTYGWMVRKGYLDFFREMLSEKYPRSDFLIENRGIPGNTAEDGLNRLRRDVLDANPDLVLIQFALNDAYLGYPIERFKNNILGIIHGIQNERDAEILLVSSDLVNNEHDNRMTEEFYVKLEEVAQSETLPIARVHEYWRKKINDGVDHSSLVQYDQDHPTVEGYQLMAQAIMELF